MTTNLRRSMPIVLTCATAMTAPTPLALAGDPTPPPGPIAPSMISLEDIAGVCINDLPGDATATHLITEPGSYYLCDDVTCAVGTSGVALSLDGLPPGDYGFNISLNGHTIRGVPGSLHGIHARPSAASTYKWVQVGGPFKFSSQTGGITNTGGDGIRVESASAAYVFKLTVTDAQGNGIAVVSPVERAEFEGCVVTGSGGNGIEVTDAEECRLSNISISNCVGHGVSAAAPIDRVTILVVDDLAAVNNGLNGINGEDYRVYQLGRCRAAANGGDGIYCEGGSLQRLGVTSTGNASHGVRVVVDSPPVPLPGEPVEGINILLEQIPGGSISGNGGSGVLVTATNFPPPLPGEPVGGINVSLEQIPGGIIDNNGDDGVTVEFDATVRPRVTLNNVTTNNNGRHGVYTRPLVAGAYCDVRVRDSDASGNVSNGMDLTGNLDINGATTNENGNHGTISKMGHDTAMAVIRKCAAVDNGGNGVTVLVEATAANVSNELSEVITNGNALQGIRLTDESADPVSVELSLCSAANNGTGGISVDVTNPAALKKRVRHRKCTAHANGGDGFTTIDILLLELDGCTSSDNTGDGYRVIADAVRFVLCSAEGNDGDGIDLTGSNPTQDQFANLIDSYCISNGGHGTLVIDCNLTIRGGAMSGNGGDGVNVANAGTTNRYKCHNTECHANVGAGVVVVGGSAELRQMSVTDNGSHGVLLQGDDRVLLAGGMCSGNTGDGIRVIDLTGTLTIEGATASANTGNGITVTSSGGTSAAVADIGMCRCHDNFGSGISVSSTTTGRVIECAAFFNGVVGIELLSLTHVMTSNMCGNNGPGGGANYSVLLPGNAVGSLIDETNIATEDNTTANYSP